MPHADIRPATLPLPDLHGHGLRLRPWDPDSEADAESWFRGRIDPEFQRWNTPLRITTDRDSALQSLRDTARKTCEGASAAYCVTDAATGTPLGHIGVNVIDRVMSSARVGYWVLPEARGRRVATRALALVARWAVAEPGLGLHRLELGHAVGHDSSCRVAERCGFRHEGTLRGAMWEAGRYDAYRDVHLHARLATDPDVEV
ncbi:acetyltransferase [Streptomyces viridochromogenes]|uniref:Acetyltransferase n=1 Tax=Streptomyces viridochromogenes TaxID=1938 RepID=A0A0J7ZF89_STRVR|nr:GNAT family N-acetyltransferase [Streptomyces viridochromogenes]KMS74791.1 acetyltransferase [Streptomyces viridochromogenes]KOG14850.1 acetyltransferase [Streptomyces viridochromogenes]KOG15044.1 acetyltransferase [Streptomyces viridochromogenes]